MRISTCTQVNVTITEGQKDLCYRNHITVQVKNETKVMLPGSRIVFSTDDLEPISCVNHPVFLYIGNHSYLGNKGTGMELLQVKEELNHLKTHIFWSPMDEAIQDITIMGEKSSQVSKVTYLNELTGADSITQITADQVHGLESFFDWTLGKNFTSKFKSYFWSIVFVIIMIALLCYLFCTLVKFSCKRIYEYQFLPAKTTTEEITE
jgi:hypothetical protein